MPNNARRLDVVFLTPTLDGGVGFVTYQLAKSMREQGLTVEIWTLAGGTFAKDNNIEYLGTDRASRSLGPLLRLLREHRPRTVLSASYHMNCVAVVARIVSRIPRRLVLVEHTSLLTGLAPFSFMKRTLARFCIRLLYPHADAWIGVSNDVASQMAQHAGLPEEQVTTIYNPVVRPELKEKGAIPMTHTCLETGEPLVLSVGRLSEEKDHANLLHAFAFVVQEIPARLLIIGDGPLRQDLEALSVSLGIDDRVTFMGYSDNPYPFFVRASVFVLPSRREGLPIVLIEALALGVPIVSTDARSGPREILHNGMYGTLVPVGDAAALGEAIMTTLQGPKKEVPPEALEPYRIETAVNHYLNVLSL